MRVDTGRVIERYVVEGLLGSGGMASVYLLRHRHLGTQHALKVLSHIGPNAEVRLMLEGKVQAALRHPNIVAVTDILEVDGTPGLLMEYVPPPSLSVWLSEHHPSVEEAESLFRGIVDGVRHAHRYGLVHRDLKPSNVLLARYDGEGLVPKVADFGLAKIVSDDPAVVGQTRSGLTMGTPQYMAPEQFRDAKKVDRRADMFSLGCILYELVAGRPPFEWTDFITLYNQILGREYARLPDEVPPRLVEAVDALLDPDRETRLPDCEALLSLLDGKGRPAQPTVSPENLGRLVDVPVLRDRVGSTPRPPPPPAAPSRGTETFADVGGGDTIFTPASPTLAAEAGTFSDARPIDQSPRPLPMPMVRGAAPTMVPDSLVPVRAPVTGRKRTMLAGGVVGALLAAAVLGWWFGTGPDAPIAPAPEPLLPVADVVPPPVADVVPPPVADGVPPPVADVVPPVADVVPPPADPAAERPPGKRESKAELPRPAVEAPRPEPPPPVVVAEVPAAPAPAHIDLDAQGDAQRVEVDAGGGRVPLPADLPAGTYTVYAWFPDAPNTRTKTLTLAAGERVRLRCMSFSMSCVTR